MKKISLLLSFLIASIISFSQTIKPFSLNDFEGKKIVSLLKCTTEIRGGWPGIPLAPTNQYHTVNREISFTKADDKIIVQKTLIKVNIDVENLVTLEHREFDTERKFDRSMEQSLVYGKYDNFIGKPFSMMFDNKNKRIDSLGNFKKDNSYFQRAWGDELLPPLQEEIWAGIFQITQPQENWKVGLSWQQKFLKKNGMVTKNENITNTFTVKSVNDGFVILDIKGTSIPEQVMYKSSDGYVTNSLINQAQPVSTDKIKYSVEQKTAYEGMIKVDLSNNLVLRMEINTNSFKKILQKDMPTTGPENTYQVVIENTLEDLK